MIGHRVALAVAVASVVACAIATPDARAQACDQVAATGFCGDGGPATAARLSSPTSVAVFGGGGFAFVDGGNRALRAVDAGGTIRTIRLPPLGSDSCEPYDVMPTGAASVLVNATCGFLVVTRDGGVRPVVPGGRPAAVAVTTDGALWSADTADQGCERDRAPYLRRKPAGARASELVEMLPEFGPEQLAATFDGALLASDGGALWRVERSGRARRMAPALGRSLRALAAAVDGSGLVVTEDASHVLRVAPDGAISTLAGTGVPGYSGDGGPATAAQLAFPAGLAGVRDGSVLIADTDNDRIRRVAPDGTITTVAGGGVPRPVSPPGAVCGFSADRFTGFFYVRRPTVQARRGRTFVVRLKSSQTTSIAVLRGRRRIRSSPGRIRAGSSSVRVQGLPRGTHRLTIVGRRGIARKVLTVTVVVR